MEEKMQYPFGETVRTLIQDVHISFAAEDYRYTLPLLEEACFRRNL